MANSNTLPVNGDSVQIEQKQRLMQERDQRSKLETPQIPTLETNPVDNNINQPCFIINSILLSGSTLLTPKETARLITPYQQRCLTLSEMQNITNSITNHYIERGYITSQAFIAEQDLTHNQLIINVIEGRINSIDIEDSPARLASMIFPTQKDNYLNLRDIEQGLEQLNRLKSAKYTIDIYPETTAGYSNITIKKKTKKFPFSAQFTLDNLGSKITGKTLLTSSITVDSLFGLGEQWSFAINSNTDIYQSHHHNRYYLAAINVPYGYWSYQYQFYHQSTRQPYKIADNDYDYNSLNINQQFDISRLLYRDNKQRFTLQASLKHKKSHTQLAQQTLAISSPRLTAISLTPQYSTVVGKGYFTFNPTAEFGVSLFGASSDSKNSPRSNYRKISLSSSYQHYFPYELTYLTSFYAQYTPDNLYSIEQIALGGLYSIRGYQAKTLNGNRGFYWRNEINGKLAHSSIGQWRFIGALDYGFIAADKYHTERHSLVGAAIGLSLTHHSSLFFSQFLIGKSLYFPSSLEPDRWSFYCSVAFSI
ncbi:ShlB/FhaC/HecB family hemolysin secretion/activation protein [Proteus hauseri]|uniref:ShlB/FhaC/HecB family hemolysin secretion/activation protein n=1 Tax=Proteus hauseri TaxID=183417 RepID=UPI0032DA0B3D